ncbi:MAG TPA: glycosyltransferase family 4 protein [Actinomycetota bacterium]|jgi:glycosyltransferase involved in cell wall biosynthesis
MRILHLVSSTDRRGAQIFASDLVGALAASDVDQHVVALRGPAGAPTPFAAPLSELVPDGPAGRFDGRIRRGLAAAVSSGRPDVIQAHGGEALKYAIPATLRRRIPVVYRRIGSTPAWASSAAQRRLYASLARRAAAVVAVSEATREEARTLLRVPADRLVTIPNAVDARRLAVEVDRGGVRRALGVAAEAPLVVSVGALTWEKDPLGQVEIAAHVLRRVPEATFLLVGAGPLREEVEAAIAVRGLAGRILVLGVREDVPDLLAASDVLVLASSTEGSPAVVIEAGLLGLPVAAYAIGGVPEIVEDGRTGVLVPAGDRERLAAEVAALLVDPDRRAAMGAAGSARCRGAFEIGAVAPRYLEVYERVAGPRVGSASGAR